MWNRGYAEATYVDFEKQQQLKKHRESCAKARKLRKAKRKSKQ